MNKAASIGLLIVTGLVSLCALPGAAVSAQNADPTMMGPLLWTSETYYREDLKFKPPGFDNFVELSGAVHYPTNWAGGPLPLIVLLHGSHVICSQGGTPNGDHWPCNPGEEVIPNFKGYDYIAQVLASYGYFVVSINANGIMPEDLAKKNLGPAARADLIKHHLDLWNTLSTTGDDQMGLKFRGKIDMTRIGLIGHSRGSEGVIRYFKDQQSSPTYGIKAIFLIAPPGTPLNTLRPGEDISINNVPLAVLLPYCDGDVKDLAGVHYYDDSRYNLSGMGIRDTAPKHTILVLGANHNFFNTVWTPEQVPEYPGAKDDFKGADVDGDPFCGINGSGRLVAAKQRTIATAYVCAFMRAYVGGESQFLPLLTAQAPPPPSVGANKVYVSFHPPDDDRSRLDINRLSETNNLSTNTLGGTVTPTALNPYELCGGGPTQRCLSVMEFLKEPHAVNETLAGMGLSQLKLGWSSKELLTNEIPMLHENISRYQALQFRASVKFDDTLLNPPSIAQNFRVVLKDGTGATASVRVADYSSALFYPPGNSALLPKAVLNTVRLPLSAFARVNLTDIRSVEFRFDQALHGSLLITDIAFVSAAHISLPVFSFDACLTDDSNGSELVFNTATGNYTLCCGGELKMSGVGRVTIRGNTVSLVQGENETDRRLVVTMDRNTGRGIASLQTPAGSLICSITDRNLTNTPCSCASAPAP